MELLLPSFIAGMLTILAPCILPLLPVILGGSVGTSSPIRPLVVALSLSISIFLFTIALKGLTIFIAIPTSFWQAFSGSILVVIGLSMAVPALWYQITNMLKLEKAQHAYIKHSQNESLLGAVLLGATLGPVFSTCSPTYGLIIATVLPSNITQGVIYLVAFCIGIFIPMLAIGYGGQQVAKRLRGAANPNGLLKKGLGVLLMIVGIAVITGLDKRLESWILDLGYFGPIGIEQSMLQ